MKLLFSIIALTLTTTLLSQQPITNNNSNDSVYAADARIQLHDLKNYTSVFTDSSNKLTIQEIASEKFSKQFQPLTGMVQPAQPYITYWLKLSILASGNIQNWWLWLNNDPKVQRYTAMNYYVDAWFINNVNQVIAHQLTGSFVPRSQKTVKERPGLNRVLFTAQDGETKYIYLRIYNEYSPTVISMPQLRNPVAGIPANSMPWVFFFSGGILFFSVISFFLFFFVKERAYLFFGFYTITVSQHYLIIDSEIPFVDLYISEQPQLAIPAFSLLTVGGFILFALFGKYFINLRQLSKKLDTVFKWVLLVWAIYLITTVVLTAITHRSILGEVNLVFILLFIIYLIRIAFFKSILVRFYVGGALWLITFTILGFLWNRSIISLPFNPWPIGQIGQLLIYAAGLAYKVRQNEKAKVQADLIRLRNVELASLYEESKKQKEEIEVQKKNADEALVDLKAAQAQLIQNEKMASLGELTAGIAHEIQNPLNFVNNFSEVNAELIEELQEERKKDIRDFNNEDDILNDIKENEGKINHHGKRADAIVKGMLQHSRSSSGVKESTDINKLADEYLRLAYHGLRAKDKSFNATMKTDYDETIGNINIIPQDIGRVILNLLNNAFYAAAPPPPEGGISDSDKSRVPTVWVSTKKVGDKVLISVKDNGPGIPQKMVDKIFQPFFTTKPTGQGTGLGLSLAYDIVKAHGGELKAETKEGEGAEFIILLPN